MNPLSLYIHFPYCVRKCRYCDFLSAPADEGARDHYVDLLCMEIRGRAAIIAQEEGSAIADTIFFGGGTPSLMTPAQLERVMEAIADSFMILPGAEITAEANPGTADYDKLSKYRSLGVNRLSIGAQSFIPYELALLGRIHTAAEIREVFGAARQAGFDNLSLDLMSALPGQTMKNWAYNLEEAVKLSPEHLSCYSLIIEDGTPFAAMELPPLPSEEDDREMYHYTGSFLREHGYDRYEISNYARKGYESRHNLGYWTGHSYLGLGLGASSYLKAGYVRFRNPDRMDVYEKAVKALYAAERDLREDVRCLTVQDQMEEFMFLGLRCTKGISEETFAGRFGIKIDDIYGEVIRKHLAQGVINRENGRLYLSEYGLDVASYVMADYLLDAE